MSGQNYVFYDPGLITPSDMTVSTDVDYRMYQDTVRFKEEEDIEPYAKKLEKRVITLEAELVNMNAKVEHLAKIVTELTEALKASQRGGRVVKYWDET